MNNPGTILEVLQGILVIKESFIGNNLTTSGPLQCVYWRDSFEESDNTLAKFNEFAVAIVGTETSVHFAPHEVPSQQVTYIRYRTKNHST